MSSTEHEESLSDVDLNVDELKAELQTNGKISCPAKGCEEEFKSIWGLKFHLKKSTCGGARFKCDDCGCGFPTRITLQEHSAGCKVRNCNATSVELQESEETSQNQVKKTPNTNKQTRKRSKLTPDDQTTVRRSGRVRTPRKLIVLEHPTPSPRRKRKAQESDDKDAEDSFRSETDEDKEPGETSEKETMEEIELDTLEEEVRDEKVNEPEKKIAKKRGRPRKKGKDKDIPPKKIDNIEQKEQEKVADGKKSVRKRGRPRKSKKEVVTQHETENGEQTEEEERKVGEQSEEKNKVKKGRRGKPRKRKTSQIEDEEEEETEDNESVDQDQPLKLKDLKKLIRSKKKLACPTGCGKSFGSALGYKYHVDRCGVSKEEKEVFACEECGKIYGSKEGLKYHTNVIHASKVNVVEKSEDTNVPETPESSAVGASGRYQRKSATRAREKVKDLINKDHLVTTAGRMTGFYHGECYLDKYILKQRPEDLITETMRQNWKKLAKSGEIQCPNKDCDSTFSTYDGIKYHYESCGFDTRQYVCTKCESDFTTLTGARKHVSSTHSEVEEENSLHLIRDGVVQTLAYSGDENDTDRDFVPDDDAEEEEEDEEEDDEEWVEELGDDEVDDDELDGEEGEIEEMIWSAHFHRYIKRSSGGSNTKTGGRTRKQDVIRRVHGKERFLIRTCIEDIMQNVDFHTKWRKKCVGKDIVHKNVMPTFEHWTKAEQSIITECIPTAHASPLFRINRDGEKPTADHQLPLFTGLERTESGSFGDLTLNVGGPVWSIEWCPVPDSCKDHDQYLMISTHKSINSVHVVTESFQEKGVVQLWNLGKLKSSSISSGATPHFSLGITHEYGPVWEASWCPDGAWQRADTKAAEGKLARLGLVALACGDGFVRIISIPYPEKLLEKLTDTDSSEGDGYSKVMVQATPHFVLVPGPVGVTYDGRRGQAFAAKWSPDSNRGKILSGYSDGTVCIWNILTESPLLKSPDSNSLTTRLAPYLQIQAHLHFIRDVAWCESDPNFILTACNEKRFRVWNLKSTAAPVQNLRKSVICEMTWPAQSPNWLYCENDLQNLPPSLRFRYARSLIEHNTIVWSFSYSPWTELCASVDGQGYVKLSKGALKRDRSKNTPTVIYKLSAEKRPEDSQAQLEKPTQKESNLEHLSEEGAVNEERRETSSGRRQDTRDKVDYQKYTLTFEDSNKCLFKDLVQWNKEMEVTDPLLATPLEAIHKVRWNPNRHACTWLATGGGAGLVRVHIIKELPS